MMHKSAKADGAISAAQQSDCGRHPRRGGASNLADTLSDIRSQTGGEYVSVGETSPLLGAASANSHGACSDGQQTTPACPSDSQSWLRRPSVNFLLLPFALSALAFGGIIVPKVNLVLDLICRDYYRQHPPSALPASVHLMSNGSDRCRVAEVQSRVATFKLLCSLISGVIAAVVAPKLGALSDRYGRKPLICCTISGMMVNEVIFVLAATFPKALSVYWIFVGSVFDGLGGSFIACMALSHSYAADCTPADRRNVVFGYFHGCLYTGIAVGPVLAGYFVKLTRSSLSIFYAAVVCHAFFLFMLLFVIPESLPRNRQLAARVKHESGMYAEDSHSRPQRSFRRKISRLNVLRPLNILYNPGGNDSDRRNLVALALIDFIIFGVAMGASTVVLLYSNYKFGWGQWQQSVFTSTVNTCRVGCLLVVLPAANRWRQRSSSPVSSQQPQQSQSSCITDSADDESERTSSFELNIVRIAIFADIAGFLGYALAPSGIVFTLSGSATAIGGIGSPTLQAAITKHVPKENVGQVLGAVCLLHAVARALGPLIFTGVYAVTVGKFTQAYFVLLAMMYSLAFCATWLVRNRGTVNDDAQISPS